MFFKKKFLTDKIEKLRIYDLELLQQEDFENCIRFVKKYLDTTDNFDDKLIFIDSVMRMIKIEIQASLLNKVLYRDHKQPMNGIYINTGAYTDEKKTIDLEDDIVFVRPYEQVKLYDKLIYIKKNPFKYDENNHVACYYTHLDFAYISNGMHSSSAGIIHKKGKILADVIDTTILYEKFYFYTDKCFDINSRKEIYRLEDFRLGLLFEIGKIKYLLQKGEIQQ
ncbi:MAG: DUF6710 family protein [Clostridia bacterium]